MTRQKAICSMSDPNTSADQLNATEAAANAVADTGEAASGTATHAPLLDRVAQLEAVVNRLLPIAAFFTGDHNLTGEVQAVEDQLAKFLPVVNELVAFAEKLSASGSGHTLGTLLSLVGSQFVAEL